MKNLTAKQEARLEKKKKKTAALTNLISLNDRDRRKKKEQPTDEDSSSSSDAAPSVETIIPTSSPVEELQSPEITRKRLKRKIDKESPSVASPSKAPALSQRPASAPVSFEAPPISTLDYAVMKKMINARKRSHGPKIRLKMMGEFAELTVHPNDRTPIFLTDVQHLVMSSVLGGSSPCMPYRWCHVERSSKVSHVVVLLVEGISLYDFSSNESLFVESSKLLRQKLEVVLPADGHIIEELIHVPLTDHQSEELITKYGSLEAAVESTRNQTLLVQSVFPVIQPPIVEASSKPAPTEDVVPRTQLLLSALQLVDEGYPIPLRGDLANRYLGYVFTKDSYLPVTNSSPLFGLDCEMCRTSAGINELTRISIVNESMESIYETLVRPENQIIDYLTQYSGITGAMMLNVTKTRADVQRDVRELLPADAILVGQSLQSDLIAMQMMHPYVIDTSCIFNLSGERRLKSKLQALSLEFLGEVIQDNPLGHDSIEDSVASLKLTKLKLAKGVDFGDAILSGRRQANEKRREQLNMVSGGGDTVAVVAEPPVKKLKSTAIIASSETGVNYEDFISTVDGLAKQKNKNILCVRSDSNKSAVRKTRDLVIQHDLTISHIKVDTASGGGGGSINGATATANPKTLSRVDRWIANCWESVAHNGLFIVILGGARENGGTGAATGNGDRSTVSMNNNHSGVVMFDIKTSIGPHVIANKTN